MDVHAMLWWMIVGHFVADYPLQSDFMATSKSPWTCKMPGFWPWVLTSHAAVHGAAVAMATGSIVLGMCETAAHWFIDLAKCAGFTGIHTDQCLHLACKVLWILAIYWGIC